jgi:hypothetical protein
MTTRDKHVICARRTGLWAFDRLRLYDQPANRSSGQVAEECREEMSAEDGA